MYFEKLERVQKSGTKMMSEWAGRGYEERLKIRQLTSLRTRRERGDLIIPYKIIIRLTDLDKDRLYKAGGGEDQGT